MIQIYRYTHRLYFRIIGFTEIKSESPIWFSVPYTILTKEYVENLVSHKYVAGKEGYYNGLSIFFNTTPKVERCSFFFKVKLQRGSKSIQF